MKKKLIYLDVGTHIGQEFMALLGHSPAILWYKFLKIRIAKLVYRNKSIDSIKFKEAIQIMKSLNAIRKNKDSIHSILIEPNYRLMGSNAYKLADKVFCFALGDEGKSFSFEQLFFPGSVKTSQGASIYKSKANIDLLDGDLVIVVSSSEFAKYLKKDLDSRFGENQYELLIRLNCEGAEDSVIYAFKDIFNDQFNTVFGSLKDVREIKGDSEFDALLNYLDDKGLVYEEFTPLYTTWNEAFIKIKELLD